MVKAKIFLCVTLVLALSPAVVRASSSEVNESNTTPSETPATKGPRYVFPFS